MTNQTTILSTKTLSPIQKQELVKATIQVIEADFIKTENASFEIKNLNKNLIFTSQNAVLSILQHPKIDELKQKNVFCVGLKTKELLNENGFTVEAYTGYAEDLAEIITLVYSDESFTLFLLGASPGVGEKLKEVILQQYPNCKIVGIYVPPFMPVFDAAENKKMVDAVNAASPDVLLVSLTAPKQDIWIANNKDALNATLMVGIGGAFEVMAGLAKRAPKWMHGAGLEWLYRLIQEPKRMYRRYLIEAPLFIPLVIRQKFSRK